MSHDVSVVIGAYNAEGFIAEALDSLLAQTEPPLEVVVIDDGSTDGTAAVVQAWAARVRPGFAVRLYSQPNGGAASARNHGIRRADGDWIAFLDADDVWEINHLQQLFAALAAAPDAVAAYGAGRVLAEDKLADILYDDLWDNPSRRFGRSIAGTAFLCIDRSAFLRLVKGNFIKPSSLVVSAAVLRRVGVFNESLGTAEDRELLARLLLNGNFVYSPMPITRYRWHANNLTSTKHAKRMMENGLRAMQLIERNQSLGLTAEECRACNAFIADATVDYLAACGRDGFDAYRNGLRFVRSHFGTSAAAKAFRPRHIASCVWARRDALAAPIFRH